MDFGAFPIFFGVKVCLLPWTDLGEGGMSNAGPFLNVSRLLSWKRKKETIYPPCPFLGEDHQEAQSADLWENL